MPDGATGDWTDQAGRLAVFQDGVWVFITPLVGWQAYVKDENSHVTFEGGIWGLSSALIDFQNVDMVGINTTADTANRLAVESANTLLTHAGDDHRLKVNKASQTDTASLLFQNDFTGHAEMGSVGSDDFSVRVSPDGSGWTTAMTINGTTGRATLPEGLQVIGSITGDGVVGTVSESGGTSTGSILEQGQNANGSYTKFASGLMIMTSAGLSVLGPVDIRGSHFA